MRSWLVIPALGAACAGAAAGLAHLTHASASPAAIVGLAIGFGAAGAAITACVRALAGDSPASLCGAVLAPLLFVASAFELGLGLEHLRTLIAIAAATWTVVELSRPSTSPLVALLPATVAGLLDATFVVAIPIAGARLMTAPWSRPRWAPLVPFVGAIIVLVAVIAGFAEHGSLAALADRWMGPRDPSLASLGHGGAAELGRRAASALGPLTAVAAIVGLSTFAKPRHAEVMLAVAVASAVAIAARTGVIALPLVALAALSAGLAAGRFAALIRISAGQAIAGATVAVLLLVAPTWSAIEHGGHPTVARSR